MGITFEAAQEQLVSFAPGCLRLDAPPLVGWWVAKFRVSLAVAAFSHYFQSVLGSRTYSRDGCPCEVNHTPIWQAAAGVTPKQWPTIKQSLGPTGANLLSFSVHSFNNTKATWISPTDDFLALFGLSLQIYDAVAALDRRVTQQLGQYEGSKIVNPQPLSTDELTSLMLWAARGGLRRLRNSDFLGNQLAACNASLQSITA